MKALSNTILEDAANCFKSARRNVVGGAELLWKIDLQKLWESKYSGFGEYVEQECQISASFAAKLIAVYGYYIEQSGLSKSQLEKVDSEKLYLALKLPDTPENKLVKAESWSRQEIRDELASTPDGDCKHKVLVPKYYCKFCEQRVYPQDK